MIIPSHRRSTVSLSTWNEFVTLPDLPVGGQGMSLHPVQGRLYVGYGDWTKNLGPTDVISVGIGGDVATHYVGAPADGLDLFREIDGWIYAPLTDPTGAEISPYGGYMTNKGGMWHLVKTDKPMVHTFDIGKTSHGLWLTGSAYINGNDNGTNPSLLLSRDGGGTWEVAFYLPPTSLGRFYGLHIEGDQPYVQASGSGAPVFTSSDGGLTWHETSKAVPNLSAFEYNRPMAFRDPPALTAAQEAILNWGTEYPAEASDPVVISDSAYVVAPNGSGGHSIYRRPAPPVPEQEA